MDEIPGRNYEQPQRAKQALSSRMTIVMSEIPLETVSIDSGLERKDTFTPAKVVVEVDYTTQGSRISKKTRYIIGGGVLVGLLITICVALGVILSAGPTSTGDLSWPSRLPETSIETLAITAQQLSVLTISTSPEVDTQASTTSSNLHAEPRLGDQMNHRLQGALRSAVAPHLQEETARASRSRYGGTHRRKRFVLAPGSNGFDRLNEMLCILAQARVYSVNQENFRATIDRLACRPLDIIDDTQQMVTYYAYENQVSTKPDGELRYSGILVGEIGEYTHQYEYLFSLTFGLAACEGIFLERLNVPGQGLRNTCVKGRLRYEERHTVDGVVTKLSSFRALREDGPVFNVSIYFREHTINALGRMQTQRNVLIKQDFHGESVRGIASYFDAADNINGWLQDRRIFICWNAENGHVKFNAGNTTEEACRDFSPLYNNDDDDDANSNSPQNILADSSICIVRSRKKEYPLDYAVYDGDYQQVEFGQTRLVLRYEGANAAGSTRKCFCSANRYNSFFTCDGIDGEAPEAFYPEDKTILRPLAGPGRCPLLHYYLNCCISIPSMITLATVGNLALLFCRYRAVFSNAKVMNKSLVAYEMQEVRNKRRLRFTYEAASGVVRQIILQNERGNQWCIKFERTQSNGVWTRFTPGKDCVDVKTLVRKQYAFFSAAYVNDEKYTSRATDEEDYLDKEEGEMLLDLDSLAMYGHRNEGMVQALEKDLRMFCVLRCLSEVQLFGKLRCTRKTRCPKAEFGALEKPYYEFDDSDSSNDGSNAQQPYKTYEYVMKKEDHLLYLLTAVGGRGGEKKEALLQPTAESTSYVMYSGETPPRTEEDLAGMLIRPNTYKLSVTLGSKAESSARALYLSKRVAGQPGLAEKQSFRKSFSCAAHLQGDRNGDTESSGAKYVLAFDSDGIKGGIEMRGQTITIGDSRLGTQIFDIFDIRALGCRTPPCQTTQSVGTRMERGITSGLPVPL
eukprot:jgi/Bigna1/78660/fgenesh1_pg.56_\